MRRPATAALLTIAAAAVALAGWLLAPEPDGRTAPEPERRVTEPPPTEPRRRAPVRSFTVSVSGDLLMHSPLLARALANGGGREYDFAPFFRAIAPWVRDADLALCHLETPLGPGPPSSYPLFKTPTGLAASIARSGWDACSTASNHSLDQGAGGIAATVAALDRSGVAHTGSFAAKRAARRPTLLKVRGAEVALIAYTDATNGIPPPTGWALNEYPAADPQAGAAAVLADARRARRAGADAVIVNLHWGVENADRPTGAQLALAKRLTDSSLVTALVGQGPHVVQPIWRINGEPVVFSEGNLVSNQSAAGGLPAATQDGLIALLRFRARGDRVRLAGVRYVPVWVRPGDYAVLPADPRADPGNAAALRASRARTIATAGSGARIEPVGRLTQP